MSLLRRLERRDLSSFGGWSPWESPYRDGRIPPPSEVASSAAGVPITEQTALGLIDTYACVALISDAMGMLPVDVFRKAGDFRVPVDPTPSLVARPDPELGDGEFQAMATTSLLLRGNAYAPIVSMDRAGYPTAVSLQHPDDITCRFKRGTQVREYVPRGGGKPIPAEEMIHLRWVTLPGKAAGLSPIECARRGLGLSIATEEFGSRWFRDGATPSSALETDQDLDDDTIKRNQLNWIRSHGGRRKPAFLTGGLKWRQISVAPEESQFLETQKLNTTKIARLFRCPPHMIGEVDRSTSWGSGIEEQGIGFVVYTLGPVLTRFERRMWTPNLPRPQYAKFNVSALLRGNTKDRYLAYAIGRQWGWLSTNDIRRLEDMPPIGEEGDVYLQPLNYVDAEAALKALLSPAPVGVGQ